MLRLFLRALLAWQRRAARARRLRGRAGAVTRALLPVITSQGRWSDVMVPMALPSVGGMLIELITLFVVPDLFCAVEEWKVQRARP